MSIMYRLRNLPKKISSLQEYKHFLLASMGLNWPESDPYLLNIVKALLSDSEIASELRNNMVEFYLCLTPEYIRDLYLDTDQDTGFTLFEFKYQIVQDMITIPLDIWVSYQITRLEVIELWDLV